MKKILLLLLISVLTINAQSVNYGIKAGYAASRFSRALPHSINGNDFESNFYGGGYIELDLITQTTFQGEILFVRKGNRVTYPGTFEGLDKINVTEDWSMNFLELNLLMKRYIVQGLSIYTGIATSITLSANVKYSYDSQTIEEKTDYIMDYMAIGDIGLVFGLTYEWPNGIFFDTRVNLGLTELQNEQYIQDYKMKYTTLMFGVGYEF